ncbi:hypothetical protein [Paenibacillus herberti]|uniref:Flagellar protein FliT n=1 Tax=Paenibacillus herberti TaxID=1619309 RepID=A0A229NW09_9BACL|nr:hypothetical protein [Paenibacillus herberti]OXM14123.1 hypothetical protein CGZ75_14200 [Paenibacillus herberti]
MIISTALDQLKHETVQLVQRLENCDYEELIHLLERRDQVLEELNQLRLPLVESQKVTLKEIGIYDSAILNRMNQLMEEASIGLQRLNESQHQKRAYESYASAGSYFIDRRN